MLENYNRIEKSMKKSTGKIKWGVILFFAVMCVQALLLTNTKAADINNIGNPEYKVQKNLEQTDAFVYAYNAKDYGADGSGNNDNTEIFQKLMNKAYELGGGIVYVPSGRYKVTGTLKIPKGVTLRGDWEKPEAGKQVTTGTILLAYTGRGGDENSKPFIEMEPETGCMDLTVWYPEQDGNNISKYSPTIRLGVDQYTGSYFGNEYTNVKNVTLLNSYIGILFHYQNGGASPVINGVYGTPLYKGIDMDRLVDVGRIENVNFSPDYWSGSGMANAPQKGSSFEKYIYDNGTGILMKRNDWSYTCYVNISGYNVGYKSAQSIEESKSAPNGNHYKFNIKNCKNGIVFDATNYVGILFNDINLYNCENGIVLKENTGDVVQFSKTTIASTKYAVYADKTSTTKILMYNDTINHGLVNVDGGTFVSVGSNFNNKAPQIAIGSLGRISLSGNQFKNQMQVINNSIYKSDFANVNVEFTPVPAFPDEKAKFQSHMPSNLTLYDVTKAPYNAQNSKNHGGGNDCTAAIQKALNDASANGGGIVFLPSGHYRMNGTIIIPSNVELRGATDLSTVPHGSGAILESYANKGNKDGTPFIKISANSGVRGVIVNYPEQTYSLTNGEYHPIDYPYTMQGLGENIYVINVGIRAATGGLDLSTYRCDNHYVDFLAGHVGKECVKVGANCKNGIINNLMFNTIVYGCGTESKFGGFPNSPSGDNSPVYTQQLRDLEFLILGDCENETLYNCFPYGAYIGTKIISQGNGGPQNLVSLGLGIDGSRKSIYFGSGLTGKMDFINNQIVSLNNDQPITRYIEAESNSSFNVNMFNTDLWGYPEKAVLMGDNCGKLNIYNANFQMRGYNGCLTAGSGSNIKVVSSNFNSHSSKFSTGSDNMSLIGTIADYTTEEKNSFKQCVGGFSSAMEIDGTSQIANEITRTGWIATASVHNENAKLSLDGNLDTQWTTQGQQTPGQWYQVDMSKNQDFDLIVTNLGKTGDVPRAYTVKISNDGVNWREVASGENNNIYYVGNQNARYIRIEQTGNEAHWWAIYEFYVLKSKSYDVGEGETVEPEVPETTTEETTTKAPETTTAEPTTKAPETTTEAPTTKEPETTTEAPTTKEPETTTEAPTTKEPETTTEAPTTKEPETTTEEPTTKEPETEAPTKEPVTEAPTEKPTVDNREKVYVAENADAYLASKVANRNAKFGACIGNMHIEGAKFGILSVDGGNKGGKAKVTVHYASNDATSSFKMLVNNGNEQTVQFVSTNGWDNFTGTTTVETTLEKGSNNKIEFLHNVGGANVDYVTITLLESQKEEFIPKNVAENKTATASGMEGEGTAPKYAIDGNDDSRWSSNFADDAWLVIDLEKTYMINKVVINWEAAYGKAYDILVSVDGKNWTTVKQLRNQAAGEKTITFDAVKARYVKVQGVERALPYGYSIWEMKVFNCEDDSEVPETSEDTNDYQVVSNNKTVFASGSESEGTLPKYAVDENDGSRWSSNFADDAWLIVDLEKNYTVNKVVINWETAYGRAYDIVVSVDGKNWTTVKQLRNQEGGEHTITFDAIKARYVKLQGVERALPYGYSIWKMSVYGK